MDPWVKWSWCNWRQRLQTLSSLVSSLSYSLGQSGLKWAEGNRNLAEVWRNSELCPTVLLPLLVMSTERECSRNFCQWWHHNWGSTVQLHWPVFISAHEIFVSAHRVCSSQKGRCPVADVYNGHTAQICTGPQKLYSFLLFFFPWTKLNILGCVTTDSSVWGPQCHVQVIRTLSLFIWPEIDSSIPFNLTGKVGCKDFWTLCFHQGTDLGWYLWHSSHVTTCF